MGIFRLAVRFFFSLFKIRAATPNSPSEPEYSFKYVIDIPEDTSIEKKTIYIIGENGNYWVVGFRCPCGCGDFVQLNLLPDGRHVWKLYFHEGAISIYPSVDRKHRCKSHFNLTKGNVAWWTIDDQEA